MAERSLVDFVTELTGESHLRVEHDYGDGFVRLHTSEAERRQAAQDIQCSEHIVLELLRNARDAHASNIFIAVSKDSDMRTLTVIDDGEGIPASMHEVVFMPRVTSKLDSSHMDAWGLHGRGMALYSISVNSQEARVVESEVGLGTSVSVTTDTRVLHEKKDQSSFPRFILDDEGTVAVRGPKNIMRTACEFAIEARNDCSVFVGSPAEIASSLYAHGISTLSAVDRAFCKDASTLPLVKRLASASDANEFAQIAESIGLKLSSRTARRILDGKLDDAPSLLDQITFERDSAPKKRHSKQKARKVKLLKRDTEALAHSVQEAFGPLAEQSYLISDVEPRIRVGAENIVITIPLVNKE